MSLINRQTRANSADSVLPPVVSSNDSLMFVDTLKDQISYLIKTTNNNNNVSSNASEVKLLNDLLSLGGKLVYSKPEINLAHAFSHFTEKTAPEYNHSKFSTPENIDDFTQPFWIYNDDEIPTCGISFSSEIESGNLKYAIYYSLPKPHFKLVMETDLYSKGNTQWFYFGIKYHSTDQQENIMDFEIVNFLKPYSLYSEGMTVSVYDNNEWTKTKSSKVDYYRNSLIRDENSKKRSSKYYYSAKFSLINIESQIIYLSYSVPYTWSMLTSFLKSVEGHPFFTQSDLCTSICGLKLPLLSITDTSVPMSNKTAVLISARVHPGECVSSWMVHGLLEFLLKSPVTPEAASLCQRFIFKVIPMMNPDGVVIGNYRCNLSGVDLNRQWVSPDPNLQPEVFYLKKLLLSMTPLLRHKTNNNNNNDSSEDDYSIHPRNRLPGGPKLEIYVDFHGHSRRCGIFAYATCNSSEGNDYYLSRIFPRLLSIASPVFHANLCSYGVGKGKGSTARVVAALKLGHIFTYTIESSFYASPINDEMIILEPHELKNVGVGVCFALITQHSLHSNIIQIKTRWKLQNRKQQNILSNNQANINSSNSTSDETPLTDCSSLDEISTNNYPVDIDNEEIQDFNKRMSLIDLNKELEALSLEIQEEREAGVLENGEESPGSNSEPSEDNFDVKELQVLNKYVLNRVSRKQQQEDKRNKKSRRKSSSGSKPRRKTGRVNDKKHIIRSSTAPPSKTTTTTGSSITIYTQPRSPSPTTTNRQTMDTVTKRNLDKLRNAVLDETILSPQMRVKKKIQIAFGRVVSS